MAENKDTTDGLLTDIVTTVVDDDVEENGQEHSPPRAHRRRHLALRVVLFLCLVSAVSSLITLYTQMRDEEGLSPLDGVLLNAKPLKESLSTNATTVLR